MKNKSQICVTISIANCNDRGLIIINIIIIGGVSALLYAFGSCQF